jgi:hypothetical protein
MEFLGAVSLAKMTGQGARQVGVSDSVSPSCWMADPVAVQKLDVCRCELLWAESALEYVVLQVMSGIPAIACGSKK